MTLVMPLLRWPGGTPIGDGQNRALPRDVHWSKRPRSRCNATEPGEPGEAARESQVTLAAGGGGMHK